MICFQYSPYSGWIGVAIAIVVIPVTLYVCYKALPKTGVGKRLILGRPDRARGDAIPDTPELAGMVNHVGNVVTPLRPVGTCDFDGKRLECVSETGYIEAGKRVEVISVEGTQLTVRLVD